MTLLHRNSPRNKQNSGALLRACLVVLVGAGTLMYLLPMVSAKSPSHKARSAAVKSPHWSSTQCSDCHGESDKPASLSRAAAETRCLECHDGKHASKEVHPIGRTFKSDQVALPKGWPAANGMLGCLTCHDALMACDNKAKRSSGNPAFLREYDEHEPLAFCGKCHIAAADATSRYSPHVMLDENGKVQDPACRFCHVKSFNLDARSSDRVGKPELRGDEITLCGSCHRRHKDWFRPGHIGRPVTREVLANMIESDAFWAVDGKASTGGSKAVKGDGDSQPQLLPLGKDKRIVCSTCHNPHQSGVFPEGSVLGRGAMKTVAETSSAKKSDTVKRKHQAPEMRGFSKEVCRVCHHK